MTVFVEPTESLATSLGLPVVPLPVRDETAARFAAGRVEPGALALDVDEWLHREPRDASTTTVLSRWVGALGYVAAIEYLDAGRPDLASTVLGPAVRRLPDDPSLRANLGMALWDQGLRYDGLAQLVLATRQYDGADQLSFHLWVLTARALSEAGRHADALELLDQIATLDPQVPMFWDLRDAVAQRLDDADAPAPVGTTVAAAVPSQVAPPVEITPAPEAPVDGGRRRGVLLGIGMVLIALAGLAIGTQVFGSGDDATSTAPAPTAEPSTSVDTTVAPTTTVPPSTTTVAPTTTTTTTTTTTVALVAVPEVVGVDRSAAVGQLESAGFVVAVVEQPSYTNAAGTVVGVEPMAGSGLEPGATVTLTVATRPVECNDAPTSVPPASFDDTAGLSAEAQAALDWAVAVELIGARASFSPTEPTDRGTAVALLWRYVCQPAPGPAPTGFADFDPTAFYADALAWAVNNDILGGTSATTLEPASPISRAAFITIVWRAIGEPASTTEIDFDDVPADAFFLPALRWSVGEGVIGGTSSTTFSPADPVSRAVAVVILDRVERLVEPLVAAPS